MSAAAPRMTCVVVDDEEMARRKLLSLLAEEPWLTCVGEACDGQAAVRLIDTQRPDLTFLDIRLPGLSGLQVLERVKHTPHVIFTTAFDEFAVAAFEIRALDYLLKPFSASRLRVSLDRAREAVRPQRSSGVLERATAALRNDVPRQIFVRTGGALLSLAVESIERIDGSDDYSRVHANGRGYLLYRRLAEFAELLAPVGFVRVHRSHIVNTSHIVSVRSVEGGRMEVTLRSGMTVVASRSRAAELRRALRAASGTQFSV
ncbi:MAG: LytR/AlgR family response regulator transcription factor [Gemmatimonadaceae bacterium]